MNMAVDRLNFPFVDPGEQAEMLAELAGIRRSPSADPKLAGGGAQRAVLMDWVGDEMKRIEKVIHDHLDDRSGLGLASPPVASHLDGGSDTTSEARLAARPPGSAAPVELDPLAIHPDPSDQLVDETADLIGRRAPPPVVDQVDPYRPRHYPAPLSPPPSPLPRPQRVPKLRIANPAPRSPVDLDIEVDRSAVSSSPDQSGLASTEAMGWRRAAPAGREAVDDESDIPVFLRRGPADEPLPVQARREAQPRPQMQPPPRPQEFQPAPPRQRAPLTARPLDPIAPIVPPGFSRETPGGQRFARSSSPSTVMALILSYVVFFLIPLTEWTFDTIDPKLAAGAPAVFFLGWLAIHGLRRDQLFQLRILTAWQVVHAVIAFDIIRPWGGQATALYWTSSAIAGGCALLVVAISASVETYEFRVNRENRFMRRPWSRPAGP